ncbi:hypothetical protein V8B97DRAFT_1917194 [Scleroderma yunnanense]
MDLPWDGSTSLHWYQQPRGDHLTQNTSGSYTIYHTAISPFHQSLAGNPNVGTVEVDTLSVELRSRSDGNIGSNTGIPEDTTSSCKRSNILADDIAFVDLSADELPLEEYSRVSVIYCAIRTATDHWCHLGYGRMCPKLRELWIRMIEGDDPTDYVWLWVDGDEGYLRKQRPHWNERIRNATPEQRLAAIAWITYNSKAVRDLTIQLGRTPKVSDAWEAAGTRLRADGCTCMPEDQWIELNIRSWFNMLTWLDGKPPIIEAIGFVHMDYRIQRSTATMLSRMVGPGVRPQVEQQLRSQVILDEAEVEYVPHLNNNYPRALRRAVAELSCGLLSCSEDQTQRLSADIPDAVLDEAPLGIKLGMIPWVVASVDPNSNPDVQNSGDKHDRWWHNGFEDFFSYNSNIFREFPLPKLSIEGLAFCNELQFDDWPFDKAERKPTLTTFVAVAMFLRKKGVLLHCCRRCHILYARFFSDKSLSASLGIWDSPGCDVSFQSSFDTEGEVTVDDETSTLVSRTQLLHSANHPGTQEPSGMETFTNLLHDPSHSLDDMQLKLTEEFCKLVQYAKSLHPRLDLSACFRLLCHDRMDHVEEPTILPALPVISLRTQDARSSKLTKARKINVIKQKLLDMLTGVKYFVANGLPWSTLEDSLAKHGFEFVNWPEGVPRENGNRGIRDLNAEHADKLYNAIVHLDAQRRLYLRPLEPSSELQVEPIEDAVGGDVRDSNVASGSKRMLDSRQHSGQPSKRIKFRPTVTPTTYSGSQL